MMFLYSLSFILGFTIAWCTCSLCWHAKLADTNARHQRLSRELNRKSRFIDADSEIIEVDNVTIAKFNKKGCMYEKLCYNTTIRKGLILWIN